MTKSPHPLRRFATTMSVLAWLAFMLLIGFYFHDMLDRQHNPNREVQTRHTTEGAREITLKRNKQGHYMTAGKINGQLVVFLLDTGATGVALSSKLAKRLDLRRGRAISTTTANGVTRSYAATLDRVSVGDIEVTNVSASITPGLQTDEALLGMSFLREVEFTQRGDELILRQYP